MNEVILNFTVYHTYLPIQLLVRISSFPHRHPFLPATIVAMVCPLILYRLQWPFRSALTTGLFMPHKLEISSREISYVEPQTFLGLVVIPSSFASTPTIVLRGIVRQ